jgi:hypothetical protein
MTAPISLAQQIEAVEWAASIVHTDGCWPIHEVERSELLCAAAATLRSLAAPPSDEEVGRAIDWIRHGFPAEDDWQTIADLLERLARQLAAKDAPPSDGLMVDIDDVLTSPTAKLFHCRTVLQDARDRIVNQDAARAALIGDYAHKVVALEQQLAAAQARIPREPTRKMLQRFTDIWPDGQHTDDDIRTAWQAMYDAAQSQERSK